MRKERENGSIHVNRSLWVLYTREAMRDFSILGHGSVMELRCWGGDLDVAEASIFRVESIGMEIADVLQ